MGVNECLGQLILGRRVYGSTNFRSIQFTIGSHAGVADHASALRGSAVVRVLVHARVQRGLGAGAADFVVREAVKCMTLEH
jgi:hypothetical protein